MVTKVLISKTLQGLTSSALKMQQKKQKKKAAMRSITEAPSMDGSVPFPSGRSFPT